MTRWPAAYLLALSFLLAAWFGSTSSEAMPQALTDSFVQNLKEIHERQPPYILDVRIKPNDPIEKGVDCSRLLYIAARRSGFLVSRVSAKDIAVGRGGWIGRDIAVLPDKLCNADEGDLLFWQWYGQVFIGHTGACVIGSKSGLLEVLHASRSRRTTVIQPLLGILNRDLVKVRRLTIGDPK